MPPNLSPQEAYQEGRRQGLALAAIACSALAFISLLGIEKAFLALVLAVLAGRGALPSSFSSRWARIACGISVLYIITYVVVLVVFHAKLAHLAELVQQLS